jgi:hypothetical protein
MDLRYNAKGGHAIELASARIAQVSNLKAEQKLKPSLTFI